MAKFKRALISVSDKTGVTNFAKELFKQGVEIISTGGTATVLKKADVKIKEVSEVTGFPEILDGRVKTLHPVVHAGILARRDKKEHGETLRKHGITPIDIIVCNLYPFEQTIRKTNVRIDEVIENIDIGGPTLIRAAAKNYRDVVILTNPRQYDNFLKIIKTKKDINLKEKERYAIEAYAHTAQYDSISHNILGTYGQKKNYQITAVWQCVRFKI